MYLLYNGIEIIACVLTFIFIMYLSYKFFELSDHFSYIFIFIMGCVYVLDTWIPFTHISPYLTSVLSMVICWFTIHVCFKGKWWHKILLVLLYNLFDILITNIIASLILMKYPQSSEELFATGSNIRILYLFLVYLSEFIVLYIVMLFNPNTLQLNIKEGLLAFIFFTCDFVVTILVLNFLVYYSGENTRLSIYCIIINLFIIASSIAGLLLLARLSREHLKELDTQQLKWQIHLQERTLSEYQNKYDAIRIIKHDMKRYLINYKLLLEDGNSEDVLKNINERLEKLQITGASHYAENPLLNALICEKKHLCDEMSIPFETNIIFDPLYKNINFMVLTSNLLDNAIEAESKIPPHCRLIQLEIVETPSHSRLSLMIRNHIEQSILQPNSTLKTTKRNGNEHGFGLKAVQQIVDSENGVLNIFEENNFFVVQVSFPLC